VPSPEALLMGWTMPPNKQLHLPELLNLANGAKLSSRNSENPAKPGGQAGSHAACRGGAVGEQ